MGVVRICAVGDVHGRRYFNIFTASLKAIIGFKPHVCIFAGDMIDEGKVEDLDLIMNEVRSRYPSVPIVSVFGNEEYHEVENLLIKRYPEILWLDDSPAILTLNGFRVGFVGTRGALERLTYWQKRHKPELEFVYRERPRIIERLIMEVRKYSDLVVLISHYATTYLTVKGEPRKLYPYMGSREMERVIKEMKPDIVIHAHAHNARVTEDSIDSVKVYNVSLPARRGIATIEIRPKKKVEPIAGRSGGTTS
jgi:Icc-related predicted phosphoesterase